MPVGGGIDDPVPSCLERFSGDRDAGALVVVASTAAVLTPLAVANAGDTPALGGFGVDGCLTVANVLAGTIPGRGTDRITDRGTERAPTATPRFLPFTGVWLLPALACGSTSVLLGALLLGGSRRRALPEDD